MMDNKDNTRRQSYFILILLVSGSLLLIDPPEVKGIEYLFSGGSGTEDDPYLIASVWDLQNVSIVWGKHFILTNDIDATITKQWNSGEGFYSIGIGGNSCVPWWGYFDGMNHTIKGLFMRQPTTDGIGLFGLTYYDTVIANFNLTISITGDQIVGGLVGESSTQTVINNIHVEGYVKGEYWTGGFVGLNKGTINNSSFSGNVRGSELCGGLVGENHFGMINRCRTRGDIIGDIDVGGLVGSGVSKISDSVSNMNVYGKDVVGGLVGSISEYDIISNSYYPYDGTWINGAHQLTFGGLFKEQYDDWITDLTLNLTDYNDTIIPNGDHFEISTVQGFSDLLGFYYYQDNKYELTSDLDLAGSPNLFLPYLHLDEFEGGNHTINNLKIDQHLGNLVGLIGYSLGDIQNIRLNNYSINGSAGGLCGINNGNVQNCHTFGTIRNCTS
jgi:hypothetical protein